MQPGKLLGLLRELPFKAVVFTRCLAWTIGRSSGPSPSICVRGVALALGWSPPLTLMARLAVIWIWETP